MTPAPNLKPLLDLTFQLLFFVLATGGGLFFYVPDMVQVPPASQAGEADHRDRPILYLNIHRNGMLLLGDSDPIENPAELRAYLGMEFCKCTEAQRTRSPRALGTLVVIRADREADFGAVYRVMQEVKRAGFTMWTIRVQYPRRD